MLQGINIEATLKLAQAVSIPVIASGGLTNLKDIDGDNAQVFAKNNGHTEVVEYLDERFQEFIKIPEFSYSQIKEKWGYSRFYCSPNTIDSREVETHIDNILNKK